MPRENPTPTLSSGLSRDFRLKAFSVLLSLILYLFVTVESDATAELDYPVRYFPDRNKVVIGSYPRTIRATLSGPFAPFITYPSADLDPIVVDLRGVDAGEVRQRIDFGDVAAPASLSVVDLEPRDFVVTIDNLITREITVVDNIVDRPPDGYKISEVRLTPSTVEVEGPETMVQTLTFVRTRPIDVSTATETFEAEVQFQRVEAPQRLKQQGTTATIVIEEEFVTRTFRATVSVRTPKGFKATAQPAVVDLSFRGPLRVVNSLSDENVEAIVDVKDEANGGKTVVKKPVIVEDFPEATNLTEMPPEVQVQIQRVGSPRARGAP